MPPPAYDRPFVLSDDPGVYNIFGLVPVPNEGGRPGRGASLLQKHWWLRVDTEKEKGGDSNTVLLLCLLGHSNASHFVSQFQVQSPVYDVTHHRGAWSVKRCC